MSLGGCLAQVLSLKGVTSAAVVGADGTVLEGVWEGGAASGFVGGLVTSALASSRVLASLLGDEEVSQTMIEYEDGPVLLTPLHAARAESPVVVVTLASAGDLGRVRFGLRKLLPEMAQVLPA